MARGKLHARVCGERVDLIEREQRGGTRSGGESSGFLEGNRFVVERVDEMNDDVGFVEGMLRRRAHRALQRVRRIQESGGIKHDHLHIVLGPNADDPVARGLRLWADDAQLLTDDAVEQGRLSGVRLAGDGEDSGTRHRRKISERERPSRMARGPFV